MRVITGRGTLRKMRQNLGWAIGYNLIALPIAAGVFEPVFGLVLRPEIAALSMSGSSFLVAVNVHGPRGMTVTRAGTSLGDAPEPQAEAHDATRAASWSSRRAPPPSPIVSAYRFGVGVERPLPG